MGKPAMDAHEQRRTQSTSAAALIRQRLEAVRESISRELCAIPAPVPGCDVNFNRLLEDRAQVVDALQRLGRLGDDPAQSALIDFARACEWLDPATREQVLSRLDAAAAPR